MAWWGKLIGGTFGFMLGGPLGALLGMSLGSHFDKNKQGGGQGGYGFAQQERIQMAFFTATFSIFGHIAKADGVVSRDEIALMQNVMRQMNLPPQQQQIAKRLFNQGKGADFPLFDVLDQFRRECGRQRNLVRMFLEIQISVALADGELHPEEKKILLNIFDHLGFDQAYYDEMVGRVQAGNPFTKDSSKPSIKASYTLLGVNENNTDAEIKRAYRRLMSQNHPDKLVAKGLPEEMMKIATQKTQEIKAAYEQVKKSRTKH